MSERASKLLSDWIRNSAVVGAAPKDMAHARDFAEQAIGEFRIEGVTAAELNEATGGDLAGHLFRSLNRSDV